MLYDGDPFEHATHVTYTVMDGRVVYDRADYLKLPFARRALPLTGGAAWGAAWVSGRPIAIALKGPNKSAQGNALGKGWEFVVIALKGPNNLLAMPLLRPFRAWFFFPFCFPGRCPGLYCSSLSG